MVAGGIGGPSTVFAFVACIAAFGPAVGVLWTAFIGGLLIDLTWGVALQGQSLGQVTFVGPHALGFTLGAWVSVNSRRIFVRRGEILPGRVDGLRLGQPHTE